MAKDDMQGIRDLFKYGAKKLSESPKPGGMKPKGPSAEELARGEEIKRANLFNALHDNAFYHPSYVLGNAVGEAGLVSPAQLTRLRGFKMPTTRNGEVFHGVPVNSLLPGHRMQLVQEGVVTPEEMSILEENGRGGR